MFQKQLNALLKNKSLWFRLLLSVGLISFLFYSVDLQETLAILRRANVVLLLAALLVACGDRILMAYKWNILLKAKGINLSLVSVTGTYLITTFLGLFLPATVGGDALRAYAIAKDGHKGSDVVSSIIIERALGFLALFIFMLTSIILSIFVFGQSFFAGIWQLFWLFLVLFVASVAMIVLSMNETVLRQLGRLFEKWPAKIREHKIVRKLEEVYRSYRSFQANKVEVGLFLLLSLVENLFPLFWTYFLSLAFHIEIPLLYFFILIPIVLVLVRLPISLDGFGIQEGAFVYFLALIGIMRPEALLLGLASHILAIFSVLPGGVLYGFSGLSFHGKIDQTGSNEIAGMPVDA